MIAIESTWKQLSHLWLHVSQSRRRQCWLLLTLMLLTSFAEVASIGAILPFLAVLTAPDAIFDHASARWVIELLKLTSADQLLLPLTSIFCLAALVAGAMRLLLLWASTRLSFAIGADLSIDIYRRTLYQSYAIHIERNSSEVINGISSKVNGVTYSTLMSTLTIISSSLMLVAILCALMAVDPIIAMVAIIGFGALYVIIIGMNRRQLLSNSQRIAHESTQVIKALQEGLGGIRDVLIDGTQETYCRIYQAADLPLRRAQGNNAFISNSPRYGVESLGMILIAVLAYTLAQQVDGLAKTIPTLGALALGAQRLLPVLQQGYAAWSSLKGGQASLHDTLLLLNQPLPDHANLPRPQLIPFERCISLEEVSFRYSEDTSWVLRGLNLELKKGERLGIIGVTGAGKSTLIDLVMGLLDPVEGALKIDGQTVAPENRRSWQKHIAHVPQSIYLSDSTIEANIAFGIPDDEIDHQRVKVAAFKAQISELIDMWPEKYQTIVGERGIRLSGGQRQRIGIARALYKQADVIIFDEATSALDNSTEQSVMKTMEDLRDECTMLIVAHRLTTLSNCTKIVELENGFIKRQGSYQEIVANRVV